MSGNPFLTPEDKCHVCGSDKSVELCVVCAKIICPRHRVGTGDLSDGYACTMTCGGALWTPARVQPYIRPQKRRLPMELVAFMVAMFLIVIGYVAAMMLDL